MKENTKEKIVDVAWQLFYEKGYDNTTVDDIINNSNTSKGSFYYYFDSKDALLSTLSDLLDDYYLVLEKCIIPTMTTFEKLLFLNFEMHNYMEHKISYELLASLYSSQLVTRSARHLLDNNRIYYRLITNIIEEGKQNNEITDTMTTSEITKLYSMCERALVYDWCLSQASYSLGEYSKKTLPILLSGIKKQLKK